MKIHKDTSVFISGGAGVIGKELVNKLLEKGCRLFVGDLKPIPSEWRGKLIYRQGDLNFLKPSEIEQFQPDYFFHLAATFERSKESYEFWSENFRHNVQLSHHLMTVVKDLPNLKKVIFPSSYLIYDPKLYNTTDFTGVVKTLTEQDPIYPRNLTGVAKLAHEIELRFINEFNRNRYKSVSVRIFRGYGKGSRDVISRWIRNLIEGKAIDVYRKEGIFDYIFAEDTAEGLIRLAESDEAEGFVNLGTGTSRRVDEVVNILKAHFPNASVNEIVSDIPYEASQANMDLFTSYTRWKPEHTLEIAIAKMIKYEREQVTKETDLKINALLSSASKKIPMLNAIKAAMAELVPNARLIAGDAGESPISSFIATDYWKMPRLDSLNEDAIISYCLKGKIGAIIPSRDGELAFWANLRDELNKHGIHVMVSDREVVETCIDKLKFFEVLNKHGFPVIPTSKKAEECRSDLLVVKEQLGAGAKSLGLNLSLTDAKQHAQGLKAPIFQPFIAGREFSVDVYVAKNGKAKGAIVRERVQVVDGESQITTSIRHDKIEQVCKDLAERLGIYGHAVIQIILDNDDNIHIIECNSRFGGASTLSIACGLHSFYWFFLEASGQNLDDIPFVRSAGEKTQVRYATDLIIEN